MTKYFRIPLLAITVFLIAFSSSALGQEITGTIAGTVLDSTGAAVAGANVTATDADKNVVVRTVTTGEAGEYTLPLLPAGNYTVTVEAPNFKKSLQTEIKLDVNQRRTLDIVLEAGNISEIVTVAADQVAVELTNATSSTVVSGDQVRELSVNNRNFVQLVTLAPGVSNDLADQVYVGTTNPAGQANTINVSVNGARSSSNTFLVDGADITDRGSNLTIQAYPSVDSIGEFRVLRSLYPAETGNSGGGQVNIITRSGGAEFHGSLFEFWRNDKLNANDFLTNANNNPPFGRDSNGKAKRGPFRYHNFGGTIGGPIYFFNFGEGSGPALRKLDRTFFFFSEEQRRDRRFPTLVSTVPDAALRQGIFPIPVCINRNDVAGADCTGANILPAGTPLPAALFNPAARSYIEQIYNKLPLPTGANYALSSAAINVADFRQEILKIDHGFNDAWSMFYRFENDKIPTVDVNSLFSSGGSLPGVSTTETNSPGKTHGFQVTGSLTPKMVLEGRYAYSYGAILSENVGLLSLLKSTNPVTLPFTNTRDRITSVSGNGFGGLTSFGPYDNFSNKHNWGSSLTWISGSHSWKFGGNYSKYRKNENALVSDATGANQGIFTTFGTGLPAGVTASTLNQNLARWANFLVGNAATFVQGRFDYTADFRQANIESYAQDEWRVKPNLTLYLGVRYSRFGQPSDRNGRLSNFDPALFNPASAPQVTGAGNRVAGTGNFCNGLFVNSQNFQTATNCTPGISPYGDEVARTPNLDFAPRFGIAWDPFGKGRTAIRTGYGIFHEQFLNGWSLQIVGGNPPYQENFTILNTRLDNPAGSSTQPPSAAASTIRGIQTDWKTPYMQHWSLDVQHQIDSKTVITVGYFGSKGTNLIGVTELNDLPPGRALNSLCAPGNNTPTTAGVTLVPCQPAGYAFRNTATTVAQGNPNRVGTTVFTDNAILDQIRPFRGYRSITLLQPRYNSNYHSLQFFGQRRFSGASQLSVAYTWAKNLTDNQTDRSTAPQDTYNIPAEYGRATLDRRHVFSANYIYELPFFKSQEGFVGKTLGGWQASGIVTLNSGLPFTITTSSFDAAGLGNNPAAVAGNRPNVLCDPNSGGAQTIQQWFNTACFQANPAAGTTVVNQPGTAGRGIVQGPPTHRVDFTMTKIIRFGEVTRLQIRGEAFNVFNHTNFRAIGTNITLGTYGQVTTVRDPRTIQLGAKFIF
ncbi:MAG TPA: carboxypeptidase regulatory-like domain-containing protein [Pyrinomonadaceae bacterium]|nr:carboxypeptidase regulatory-like domain-containing protein [Pyrinomonadaceae bacterium]